MKNIFVPTDFSACATNATHAAIELAAAYQATLHLYTVIEKPKEWSELEENQKAEIMETNQAIHNAELLLKDWEGIAKEKKAPIKTGWAKGSLLKFIDDYIQSNDIDFVVMGSHGISGKSEYFIGSNTQKVVRLIHTPVLVIKEKLEDFKLKNVVFASTFNHSDRPVFQYLLDFVKTFKPTIHLTQVNTSSWFGQPYMLVNAAMDEFKKMAEAMNIHCELHFQKAWTIDAGIRNLSKEMQADLIAISNEERHPLKRIFSGSNVEALVNHAEMPVLSIDFRDV